ncbi:MAG: hypothetical protein MUE33_11135 [Cytophagaceae bacterium]|jgi:uncharacterized tellurite resistance protein B-like protein|nr:hypothetical protein [Cytophagaceae bacterium]
MSSEDKKILLLLHLIIFNYHGLDEKERVFLQDLARHHEAKEELQWAYDKVGDDYYSSYDAIHSWFDEMVTPLAPERRLWFLEKVWEANVNKGFISEMEATAMLKIAKRWSVQKELLSYIRK